MGDATKAEEDYNALAANADYLKAEIANLERPGPSAELATDLYVCALPTDGDHRELSSPTLPVPMRAVSPRASPTGGLT